MVYSPPVRQAAKPAYIPEAAAFPEASDSMAALFGRIHSAEHICPFPSSFIRPGSRGTQISYSRFTAARRKKPERHIPSPAPPAGSRCTWRQKGRRPSRTSRVEIPFFQNTVQKQQASGWKQEGKPRAARDRGFPSLFRRADNAE